MIIFAAILFFLLVFAIKISFFVMISPALLGLAILVVGNFICLLKCGKVASVIWDLVTVGVTVYAEILLCRDIFSESVNYGEIPFVILMGYAGISLVLLIISTHFNRRGKFGDK